MKKEQIAFYWYGWLLSFLIAVYIKSFNPNIRMGFCMLIALLFIFVPTIAFYGFEKCNMCQDNQQTRKVLNKKIKEDERPNKRKGRKS